MLSLQKKSTEINLYIIIYNKMRSCVVFNDNSFNCNDLWCYALKIMRSLCVVRLKTDTEV